MVEAPFEPSIIHTIIVYSINYNNDGHLVIFVVNTNADTKLKVGTAISAICFKENIIICLGTKVSSSPLHTNRQAFPRCIENLITPN